MIDWTTRAVAPSECGARRPAVGARAGVPHHVAVVLRLHICVIVRQVKERTGAAHGQRVAGVQAKEPDPRLPLSGHVGADVEFGERRDPGQWWEKTRARTGHAEGCDPEP